MINPCLRSNLAQRIQFETLGWHITNRWKIVRALSSSLYLEKYLFMLTKYKLR